MSHQMTSSPPLPIEWVLDASRDPPVYTRPMAGSEIPMQRYWNMSDGGNELCAGINFTCSLGLDELKVRARTALDKLRFVCPIIACTVEDVVSPRWIYTPSADREAWLDLAFVVRKQEGSLNAPQFIQNINLKRLPYVDGNKAITYFRVYLLTTSNEANSSEYGLYFHGPHTIIEGGPLFHALNLMCEWISGAGMDVRIEPLEEWKNLPVDPVTATGGPCKEWETSGARLVRDYMEQRARTTPLHTLQPPSRPLDMSHPLVRYTTVLSESETAVILAGTKKLGVSISALFYAAHCLAQFRMNPVPETTTDIDFPSEVANVALERYLKSPVNPKTHFITSSTVLPLRFSMAQVLMEPSEKARLIMTAKTVQDRFDKYLAEPCLPHLMAAVANAPLTARKVDQTSGFVTKAEVHKTLRRRWGSLFSNLGIIDQRLQTQHGALTIDSFHVGGRSRHVLTTHMWMLRSRLHLQVQGATAWGENFINKLLQETLRIALLVVELESPCITKTAKL